MPFDKEFQIHKINVSLKMLRIKLHEIDFYERHLLYLSTFLHLIRFHCDLPQSNSFEHIGWKLN